MIASVFTRMLFLSVWLASRLTYNCTNKIRNERQIIPVHIVCVCVRQSCKRFSVLLVFANRTSHPPVRGRFWMCVCSSAHAHTLIKSVQNNNLPVMIILFCFVFSFNFIFYMQIFGFFPWRSICFRLDKKITIIYHITFGFLKSIEHTDFRR